MVLNVAVQDVIVCSCDAACAGIARTSAMLTAV